MKIAVRTNADDVARRLHKMSRAVPHVAADYAAGAAEDAVAEMGRRSPVDTGALRDSWEVESTRSATKLVNRQPYAGFQTGLEQAARTAVKDAADRQPSPNTTLQKEVP